MSDLRKRAILALWILAYVMMGTITARIATAVVGPADALPDHSSQSNTAARSVIVAILWPLALPGYLFIAAGRARE